MPVGYGSKCKVCNCEHRAAADQHKLADGWSDQRIADWLGERGVKVSREAVRSHFANHMDLHEDARRQYHKAQKIAERAVEKRVSDIERLDRSIEMNAELAEAYATAAKPMLAHGDKLTIAQVTAGTGAFSELRQAIQTKAKLLGDTPQDDLTELLVRALTGEDAAADG